MTNFLIAPSQEFDGAEQLRQDTSPPPILLGRFALERGRTAPGAIGAGDEVLQPRSGKQSSRYVDGCRKLTARCYVREGYVNEHDLDDQGYLNDIIDPYVNDSEYFWKTNKAGEVVATLRIIRSPQDGSALPIEKSFSLFSSHQAELSEVRRKNPAGVVEISALAKSEGADRLGGLDMYRAVWQYAKRTRIELCAISADIRLHSMLSETFGAAIDVAGEPSDVMGSLTVPAFFHPDEFAEAMAAVYKEKCEAGKHSAASYKKLVKYFLDGLDTSYLSSGERAALDSMGLSVDSSPYSN